MTHDRNPRDNDSRTTGDLRPMTGALRKVSDSIRTKSPTPSAITGTTNPDNADARSLGAGRGGRGAVAKPDQQSRARRVLRALDLPEAAGSLVPSVDSALTLRPRSVIGIDGQFERTVIDRAEIRDGADPRELIGLRRAFAQLVEPAGEELATALLAELSSVTMRRAYHTEDDALTAIAFTSRLAVYPPDVAKAACEAWADREKFWPSWAELKAECDRRMCGRLAVMRALEGAS